MTLNTAEAAKEYVIREIRTEDAEMRSFLFSLGCYSGERVTVVSKQKNNMVIAIRDGRYNIDREISGIIEI